MEHYYITVIVIYLRTITYMMVGLNFLFWHEIKRTKNHIFFIT